MLTFLHAADIHVDSPLRNLDHYEGAPVDALRLATRRAMENLVDLAISRSVDFVLVSGDIYDGDWKDHNTGLWFTGQMSRLRRENIPVFMVAGNHDAVSRMTRTLRFPENVTVFPEDRPETILPEDIPVAIHGQSFHSQAVKTNLAAGYPERREGYFNIGMLHTSATGRSGHEPYAPCRIEDMTAKGYDYWALGHVHQREILCREPLIVFPGNIQGRHVRETGAKGCMAVTVDDLGRAETEFCPLDVIRWERLDVDISGLADADAALAQVADQLENLAAGSDNRPLAVRVDLNGISSAHGCFMAEPDHWIAEIRARAIDAGAGQIWIEKVLFSAAAPETENPEKFSDGPIRELLDLLASAGDDPEMRATLARPLDALQRKLPKEFRELPDALRLDDDQWVMEMLNEVRPMLLKRLGAD